MDECELVAVGNIDTDGDGCSCNSGYGYGDGQGINDSFDVSHSYGADGGSSNGYGTSHSDGSSYDQGDGHGCSNSENLLYISHETPIIAWWRLGERKHFGEPLDTAPGAVHEWPYKPVLCGQGLHACLERANTTLYNSGPLFRVACAGWMRTDDEKLVCTRRVIIKEVDHEL